MLGPAAILHNHFYNVVVNAGMLPSNPKAAWSCLFFYFFINPLKMLHKHKNRSASAEVKSRCWFPALFAQVDYRRPEACLDI